jgi:hypothetical protein
MIASPLLDPYSSGTPPGGYNKNPTIARIELPNSNLWLMRLTRKASGKYSRRRRWTG